MEKGGNNWARKLEGQHVTQKLYERYDCDPKLMATARLKSAPKRDALCTRPAPVFYHLMACMRRATSSTFALELNALIRK